VLQHHHHQITDEPLMMKLLNQPSVGNNSDRMNT
jgi:hypothetical protein